MQAALSPGGVVDGITAGKSYVDMSTVDEATSQQIAAAVTAKGGRFLEVRVGMQRMRLRHSQKCYVLHSRY
jgi:3-hydroxyisobutyrate dehydrogenase-like beta-hydroxyacid dehydrogenase